MALVASQRTERYGTNRHGMQNSKHKDRRSLSGASLFFALDHRVGADGSVTAEFFPTSIPKKFVGVTAEERGGKDPSRPAISRSRDAKVQLSADDGVPAQPLYFSFASKDRDP